MSIPELSQEMIREYATSQSWQRGQTYYEDDCVRRISQRGKLITAEVLGNDIRPYRVTIDFSGDELDSAYCTCPYDWGGYCKHIVAALLVCLRDPDKIQSRQSLEQLLDRLNEIQTQNLIQELVANKPELLDDIEHFADRVAPPMTVQIHGTKSDRKITIDSNRLKSQVRYILEDSVRHYEYGGEEDIATEEISSLIQDAQMYTQRGDYGNAIAMLTAITESCVENWDIVDDYGVDNDQVAEELSDIWCETILSADITAAEKVDLQVNLEYWRSGWGEYFEMAIATLEQGWEYPPLKQVLQGNITASGAWEGEAPDYADDLALIRLQILERQQRFQEYLYLAEAEGQVTKHLTMLVRLDRVTEAMQAAQQEMSTMEEALAFSQALLNEQNAQPEALAIAERGLDLPGRCQYDLATWTSEIAEEVGDRVLAIKAKVKAFQAQPSFVDYRKVEQLAQDNWSNIKGELLAALVSNTSWGTEQAQVDIYLYEGLIDKAIVTVDNFGYYRSNLVQRVMDAAVATNPDWVIKNAGDRAEAIMDAGKAKYYDEAVEWLKKVRNAYIASDRKHEWSDYRTKLMTVHARKRKLMGLMKSVV